MNLNRFFSAMLATAALILTTQLNPSELSKPDWTASLLQRLRESGQNFDQLGSQSAVRNLRGAILLDAA